MKRIFLLLFSVGTFLQAQEYAYDVILWQKNICRNDNYGVDVLVNTVENAMTDQLKEGDYDFWKSLTGGLIEAGVGKIIPMKYVDKLEN
ncbi:hypothetical protein [Vaginella massiliensis]|uniref:hypothetical protein n=1 Tax=Vaginella massiliensis TaxID=1816680 RepID=UPI0008391830|nr:hypothetical protein [Vaginella massiliensis]